MKAVLPTMLALIVGALAACAPAGLKVTKGNAFTAYQGFTRLTKEPHMVAPLTATLCTIPSPDLIEAEKKLTGPHHMASVHLYANAQAQAAVTKGVKSFATGSVIVKEKIARDGSASAVGGMIKRSKGYDAQNSDWEYFYAAKTGEFSTGRLQNCIDCHRQTKTNDYVFSVWEGFK